MKIIGCDFHPSFQQIAMFDSETGEITELRLSHANAEATKFYESLTGPAVGGGEASGNKRRVQRLLARVGDTLFIGGATKMRARHPRQQKTDKREARDIFDK